MDYSIVFLVIFLVGFGLVMIYSTSSYKGSLYMGDAAYWLKRQAVFAVIGLLAMFFLARIDYHILNLKRWFPYVYYVGIILLLFFTIAFASVTNGSKRWLTIGPISFQSSEMAKLVIIVVLAIYISQKARELRTTRGIIKAFALTIPIIGVVGIENLSTSIILLAISVIMIFVASNKWLPFLAVGAVGVAGAVALLVTQSYRMGRILVWLHPEDYDNGLQTLQGLYAIGSGGLFGKGLGNSMQKMGFLPETHNDMIFSIICEELGLFGAVRVIILYFVLIWRFMIVAVNAADLYGSMIVIGVIAHIGIQVFINIGVVTNTIPNTGIPLPFISYGGTSLCFLLIEMGLVLSVSRYMRLRE
ncbi:MAG: FtsW/RodA/SpoVE family cell cycle protein [Clostridiales bacterium]|nr:FtsW/RodA/SpoVE family cell cycle protein [Clostridiales bacterium]